MTHGSTGDRPQRALTPEQFRGARYRATIRRAHLAEGITDSHAGHGVGVCAVAPVNK